MIHMNVNPLIIQQMNYNQLESQERLSLNNNLQLEIMEQIRTLEQQMQMNFTSDQKKQLFIEIS